VNEVKRLSARVLVRPRRDRALEKEEAETKAHLVKDISLLLQLSELSLDGIEPISDSLGSGVVQLTRKSITPSLVGVDGLLDISEGLDVLPRSLEGCDLVESSLLGGDGEGSGLDLFLEVPGGRKGREKKSQLRRRRRASRGTEARREGRRAGGVKGKSWRGEEGTNLI